MTDNALRIPRTAKPVVVPSRVAATVPLLTDENSEAFRLAFGQTARTAREDLKRAQSGAVAHPTPYAQVHAERARAAEATRLAAPAPHTPEEVADKHAPDADDPRRVDILYLLERFADLDGVWIESLSGDHVKYQVVQNTGTRPLEVVVSDDSTAPVPVAQPGDFYGCAPDGTAVVLSAELVHTHYRPALLGPRGRIF